MNTKQGILFISVALLLFCTFTSVASAKTWYVDDDGGAGIDFTMIQDAINVAKSGETIIVRNGTYTEKVEVYVNYLTIKSENGSASTIVQAVSTNDPVFKIISDYVTISGFTVTRSGKAGISLYYADYCTISNNTCSDNSGDGIILRWSNSNRIMNNTCSKNAYGIYLMESNDNILSNNNFSHNDGDGMFIEKSNSNSITNNICSTSNKWDGIYLKISENNSVTNNICSDNG